MTSEELRQKYRLLKLVAEQGVRTYHALNARGHIVMVHHLPSDSPETQRLLTLLDALGPLDKMRIVERLTVDGAPVVVTQFIQGFQTLPVWLQATAQRVRGAPSPAAAAPPPRAGELTQLFGPTSGDKPPPDIVPPQSPEAPGSQPVRCHRCRPHRPRALAPENSRGSSSRTRISAFLPRRAPSPRRITGRL